jgi:glycosyltransferase involved in cell wall biosynthesis
MKVLHIVPGAGGEFYCENCLRDTGLVRMLIRMGHDVTLVPLYLPMYADDADLAGMVPVFFGGINVYLQQKVPLFRHTPRWLDRWIDSRWLLRLAARRAGSTRARDLGDTTLSMLRGEEGFQAKELDRLARWLRECGRPDVVHLSNALLIGLAGRLRRELQVPILCTLQDEDKWLDAMDASASRACWTTLAEQAVNVDAFVAVSRHYGESMARRLGLPADKFHVVYPGLNPEGHRLAPLTCDPPVIGFLSRLSQAQGLGELVAAFIALKRDPRFARVRLRATGGQVGDDHRFASELRRQLAAAGVSGDVEFVPIFDRASRMAFLESLSVLCVPVPGGEAFGLFVVEAMASGVPSVEPRVGAFPELLADGGGILYEPSEPGALTAALASLLTDPEKAREMGRRAHQVFLDRFTLARMTEDMVRVYETVRGTV